MQTPQPEIAGNLQAKIMMLLKEEPLCGVDLMKRLRIKSPGTIYPVLDALKTKGLIDYNLQTAGATRKKTYFLTELGKQKIRSHLTNSVKFCCDTSDYISKIVETVGGLVKVERRQKVLSTLDHPEVKRFLKGADATYSSDLNVPHGSFDLALGFLGVGCLLGAETADVAAFVNRLFLSLRGGGTVLVIEVEQSDNMFSQILFKDVFGLSDPPGLDRGGLEATLCSAGFGDVVVTCRMGLLYAVGKKSQERSRLV